MRKGSVRIQNKERVFTVPSEMGEKRLDYVIGSFLDSSRKEAKEIVEKGFVLVNKIRVTFASRKVKKGDRIEIIELGEPSQVNEPEILYEDDSLIVVNKPAGMLTEKVGSEKGIGVDEILKKKGKEVYPVHRLDRETSGVLVYAKDILARNYLIEEFRLRRVNKIYIAVVDGIIQRKKGVLKGIMKTGEYGETHYEVIKGLKGATLLMLFPKTGRTHQIRLQLSQIGHPVIGDRMYYNFKKSPIFFNRQALHSYKISFIHPKKKRWVTFSAPISGDIKRLIQNLNS